MTILQKPPQSGTRHRKTHWYKFREADEAVRHTYPWEHETFAEEQARWERSDPAYGRICEQVRDAKNNGEEASRRADQVKAEWDSNAPARHLMGMGKECSSERETGPTITAVLERGPLAGRRIETGIVEGRPPKTIDVRADDGSSCRYCLADWVQSGPSAIYTFLYRA